MAGSSRREFFKNAGAGIGAVSLLSTGSGSAQTGSAGIEPISWNMVRKPNVRIIFSCKEKGVQGWPNSDLDGQQRSLQFRRHLQRMNNINFTGYDFIAKNEQAEKILSAMKDDEVGILMVMLSSPGPGVREIISSGKPVIIWNDLFGGDCSFLGRQKWAKDNNYKVISLSTTDVAEVERTLKLFAVMDELRNSKILHFRDRQPDEKFVTNVKDNTGVTIETVSLDILESRWKKMSDTKAQDIAKRWINNADKVVEPPESEIVKSAKVYLAFKDLIKERKANAVTVDCLGGFYSKKLSAYPCLGFVQLNDEGLTGVCEADLAATLTQMIVGFIADRPGYVSDPVLDTGNNTIIHAHCLAATKMGGVNSKPEPHYIRTHAEDEKGASLQVKMRVGQAITAAKLVPSEKMLVSAGTITGNSDEPRACRTKIITKVSNVQKMLDNYEGGLHRIIFYGDWRKDIAQLGKLMGFETVDEMA